MTSDRRSHFMLRAYDWALRKRLIREPQWGQPSFVQRLVRIRPLAAVALSLPALALCISYALLALAAHLVQQRATNVLEPLTAELFQLHLHDRLVRDWQRLTMPEPQRKSPLPTYGLIVGADKLDDLERHPPVEEGPSYYVDGTLVRNGQAYETRIRYRGTRATLFHDPQQSWKVRLKDGRAVEGFESFSFINTLETVPFEEDIVLEIAREQGLLTPEYFPFRLLLNKSYMGVYFFEAQPDEGLLRRERRVPGSIYSGGDSPIDTKTGISTLFRSPDHFVKVAQGVHQQLGERSELEALIHAINESLQSEFADYASRHLDLDKFALFDALDVVFGCNQHDFGGTQKFYYDPYRERFEPIAWNFRGCKHETEFNRTDNPLLLRLKTLPGYFAMRNRLVNELLHGAAAPESLRERVRRLLDAVQADQVRDPFWDAHQLLPPMNAYYSQLRRPVNRDLQDLTVETRLFELGKRRRYLESALKAFDISATIGDVVTWSSAPGSRRAQTSRISALDVDAGGESGYRIVRVEPVWIRNCAPGSWKVYADTTSDARLDQEHDRLLASAEIDARSVGVNLEIYPGVRFDARPLSSKHGAVRAMPEPRRYRLYFEHRACELIGVSLDLKNLATGESRRIVSQNSVANGRRPLEVNCGENYHEVVGYHSPHPWCTPQRLPETLHWGPGIVSFDRTRVFDAEQAVVIAPGTRVRMAKGASLVFRGRVEAVGTRESPISFEPDAESWGGILIMGPYTRTSRFAYVTFMRGTRPGDVHGLVPGTVNLHDSAGITLEHCRVLDTNLAEVGLHVTNVRDLIVGDLELSSITGDGIAVSYSSAKITHLDAVGIGHDAIVIDGSDVDLSLSKVIGAKRDAVRVGAAARATLDDLLVTAAQRGLYVRQASVVEASGILAYKNEIGIQIDSSDDSFAGKSRVRGEGLYGVECKTALAADNKKRKPQQKIIERLASDDLQSLRKQVLDIKSWDALDSAISTRQKRGQP